MSIDNFKKMGKNELFDRLEDAVIKYKETKESIYAQNIALIYFYLEQYDRAIKKLEQVRLMPLSGESLSEVLSCLGSCYGKKGLYKKTVNVYQELAVLGHQTGRIDLVYQGCMGKGIALTLLGKLSGDKSLLEEALKEFKMANYEGISKGKLAAIHSNTGEVYQAMNEHEKAIELYTEAIKVHESERWKADTLNSLALSLALLQRYKDAHEKLTESYEICLKNNYDSSLCEYFKIKGLVSKLEGELDQAYVFLNRSKMIGKDKGLYIALAEICYMLGDIEKDINKAAMFKAEHDMYVKLMEEEIVS